MSKRQRAESPQPSSSNSKSSRVARSTTREIICQLPPTCNVKPTVLEDTKQLEAHYSRCHAHVCEEENCRSIFPERRLLDLHHTECHDPIAAIRKERGERIFACFDLNCKISFMTPKGRRLHLIDKHKYPANFFFSVTNYGIGQLLMRWGEGVSLLRNEWKPRNKDQDYKPPEDDDTDMKVERSDIPRYSTPKAFITPSPNGSGGIQTPPTTFHKPSFVHEDPVDTLANSMSSLSLVPTTIQFGRGGMRSFQHGPRGRGRGRGRMRGRGRGMES